MNFDSLNLLLFAIAAALGIFYLSLRSRRKARERRMSGPGRRSY